jgi:hypothetical protein
MLLSSQHFGGRGVYWSSGMGTMKNEKHQLLTRTYTNQTRIWLVHSLSTFGAQISHKQTQPHHGPDLGGSHHLPLYSILFAWPHD